MSLYPTELDQLSILIQYIAEETKDAMRTCTLESNEKEKRLPSVEEFVFYMVTRSCTTAEELIMCAVYLSRFQKRLPPAGATMRPSTPHRIFLAALILAHKVHNDDSVNNACWAGCSVDHESDFDGFSNMEVNRIEKQFLALVEWEIHISAGQYEKQCLAFIEWRIHTSASRYGRFTQDAYTTYSNPPKSVDIEPRWACSCCICIEWWTNSAQGLWHCFNYFTTGDTEVEMRGGTTFHRTIPCVATSFCGSTIHRTSSGIAWSRHAWEK